MKNFFLNAPAWISNLLSIVLALLVTVSTVGTELIQVFTDLNCTECLRITQIVLSTIAVILSILKAFSKAKLIDIPDEKTLEK